MNRYLYIVGRDRVELYDVLRQEFSANQGVRILLDRRNGDRRKRTGSRDPERRTAERRRRPFDGFAVLRET
ncbi:MAG: hypothetical protein HY726_04735 [Candidatus Rokubacteria bacterium]|nr:hypothetical protein [Candidatus Rokubacteria bacterium]